MVEHNRRQSGYLGSISERLEDLVNRIETGNMLLLPRASAAHTPVRKRKERRP